MKRPVMLPAGWQHVELCRRLICYQPNRECECLVLVRKGNKELQWIPRRRGVVDSGRVGWMPAYVRFVKDPGQPSQKSVILFGGRVTAEKLGYRRLDIVRFLDETAWRPEMVDRNRTLVIPDKGG